MRTVRALFPRLVDSAHLESSARLCVRGKRRRPEVASFLFRAESELARLAAELGTGRWRHGPFRMLFVRDPKPRLIAKAGIEDRVVHTALVRLMEPAYMPSATDADFACRAGFGTHRARIRLLELQRRHAHVLHLDLRSYFPSIDLAILRELLRARLRDAAFLEVVDGVLAAGERVYRNPEHRRFARLEPDWPPQGSGLPIGAFTSQFLAAHVYLLALDHRIQREWKVPGYVRYVDDLFLFGDDRRPLERVRDEVAAWLWSERRAKLKVPGARVRSCHGHLDALGCRIDRGGIAPLRRQVRALAATVARDARRDRHGGVRVDLKASVESRLGGLLSG